MMRSFICSTLVLLLLISSQAFAAQPEVTITEIFVDNDNKQIVIMGENFDIGPDPTTVSFGGFGNLNITTNTSTLLVVDFPAEGLQEGIYPLAVSSGPGARKNDEAIITIGAQGPTGVVGPITHLFKTQVCNETVNDDTCDLDLLCPGSSRISGGGCLCQATFSPPHSFEFTNGFQYLANGPTNCDGDGCTRWFCSCFNNSTDTLDLDLSINLFCIQ